MFLHPANANIEARLGPKAGTLLSTLISVRIQLYHTFTEATLVLFEDFLWQQ